MSIPLPASYTVIDGNVFTLGQMVREGSSAGVGGELDLVENMMFAWATLRSGLVSTLFRHDAAVAGVFVNYAVGAASAQIRALWDVPVGAPWTHLAIRALVQNTSGSHAATLRFDLASDPYTGTYVDITVAAGSAAWTEVTGDLAIDSALGVDTVRMTVLNGASGELRVHSVHMQPKALTSIPADPVTVGALEWIPIDSTEADGSSPLTVSLRNRQWTNLEAIRLSRLVSIVAWSEYVLARTLAYEDTSGDWVEALRVPFRAGAEHSEVRWAWRAQASVGASAPAVRLRTGTMAARDIAWQSATAPSGWTTPYAANRVAYDDTGLDALVVAPGVEDELIVEIRECSLRSLSAWLA